MQFKVGDTVNGKVTGVTKFGAFIKISDSLTGLVHISEISESYVVNVSDFLESGDSVKVKILSLSDNRLSLSIKQAQILEMKENNPKVDSKNPNRGTNDLNSSTRKSKSNAPPLVFSTYKNDKNLSFEEMLNKFKKNSEEKISDMKKNTNSKRTSYSRKK